MNDIDPTSVLADDYDAVTTNFELIIGPWLLSILTAWAVQYIARRYGRASREPAARETVFYGTWLFYLFTNIRFLDGEISGPALLILAFMFFPLPAFMIPCTIYYVRTFRARGARSVAVVSVIATTGVAAQVGWIDYLAGNPAT